VAVSRLRAQLEDKAVYPNARLLQHRAAVEVLKMTGVAEPEPTGPVEPADSSMKIRLVAVQRHMDETMAKLASS
jgi:hypothetical protein